MHNKKLENKYTETFWKRLIKNLLIICVILGAINIYLWFHPISYLYNLSLVYIVPHIKYFLLIYLKLSITEKFLSFVAIFFVIMIYFSYHKKS